MSIEKIKDLIKTGDPHNIELAKQLHEGIERENYIQDYVESQWSSLMTESISELLTSGVKKQIRLGIKMFSKCPKGPASLALREEVYNSFAHRIQFPASRDQTIKALCELMDVNEEMSCKFYLSRDHSMEYYDFFNNPLSDLWINHTNAVRRLDISKVGNELTCRVYLKGFIEGYIQTAQYTKGDGADWAETATKLLEGPLQFGSLGDKCHFMLLPIAKSEWEVRINGKKQSSESKEPAKAVVYVWMHQESKDHA